MQINPGIILSGQQPDFVNTLARSTQAAQLANQNRDQNALRQLFQTQGPQIMAGEGNALNSLAQIDPNAALGIQGARQDMQAQQQRMGILSAAEKRAVQEHAMRMSAAERQQQAAQVQQGIMQGISLYRAGDLNGLNQMLTSVGEAPIPSLDAFPGLAAKYNGVLDVLTELRDYEAGPKPADEYQRYVQEEATAGRKPLTRIDYEQAKKGRGLDIQLADGTRITEGGAADVAIPQMNVEQGKNTGFLIRMNDANDTLNGLEDQGLNFWQQNADSVPLGLGNYLRTPEFQRFDQARRDFVNALLRRESGAVISDQEFDNAEKQYFPVPGDSPEVIAQKRKNRENAIRGIRASSGPGAGYADQLKQPQPTQNQQAATPQPGVTEDGYRFLGGDPGDPKNWEKVD